MIHVRKHRNVFRYAKEKKKPERKRKEKETHVHIGTKFHSKVSKCSNNSLVKDVQMPANGVVHYCWTLLTIWAVEKYATHSYEITRIIVMRAKRWQRIYFGCFCLYFWADVAFDAIRIRYTSFQREFIRFDNEKKECSILSWSWQDTHIQKMNLLWSTYSVFKQQCILFWVNENVAVPFSCTSREFAMKTIRISLSLSLDDSWESKLIKFNNFLKARTLMGAYRKSIMRTSSYELMIENPHSVLYTMLSLSLCIYCFQVFLTEYMIASYILDVAL